MSYQLTSKMWYIQTVNHYLAIKKNEVLIDATTWMNLLFVYLLWLHWVSIAAQMLSPVAASGITLCSSAQASFPCRGFFCCRAWALGLAGFSNRGRQTQQLQLADSVVDLQHVESSQTRDWTHVPGLGRQILNMDESQKNYARLKAASHKRLHIVWFHLYEMSIREETGSRLESAWNWECRGRKDRRIIGKWHRVSFWGDENVLKLTDGGDTYLWEH